MKLIEMYKEKKTISIILFASGIILMITSLILKKGESQQIIRWLAIGLFAAIVFVQFFSNRFGHKPTRLELEDRVFGKEKNQKVK